MKRDIVTHHQSSPLLLATPTPPIFLAAITTLLLFTHTDHISPTQSSHRGHSSSAHIVNHQSTTLFFEDTERDRKQEAPTRTKTMRCLRGRGRRPKNKNEKSCVRLKNRACTGIRTNIGSGKFGLLFSRNEFMIRGFVFAIYATQPPAETALSLSQKKKKGKELLLTDGERS